jgi:hypothetical protein
MRVWLGTGLFVVVLLNACHVLPDFEDPRPRQTIRVDLPRNHERCDYHVLQINFKPGEIEDPWHVRFTDKGSDVPFFVWDDTRWRETVGEKARDYAVNKWSFIPEDFTSQDESPQEFLRRMTISEEVILTDAILKKANDHPSSVSSAIYLVKRKVKQYRTASINIYIVKHPPQARAHLGGEGFFPRTNLGDLGVEFQSRELCFYFKKRKFAKVPLLHNLAVEKGVKWDLDYTYMLRLHLKTDESESFYWFLPVGKTACLVTRTVDSKGK